MISNYYIKNFGNGFGKGSFLLNYMNIAKFSKVKFEIPIAINQLQRSIRNSVKHLRYLKTFKCLLKDI